MMTELLLSLLVAAVPAPDSLVLPMRADTLTETELTVFPPAKAKLPVSFEIAWGDGETLRWTQPSMSEYTRYHRYRRHGDYLVRVRAKDADGKLSGWSKPVKVTVTRPVLKWSYPTIDSSPVIASPALDESSNVYFGDEDGRFYSFDPEGRPRWLYRTQGAVYAAASIFKNNIYVASLDSHLYCLDTKGKLRWKVRIGDELYTAPAVGANGTLYLGTDTGLVVALNPHGKILWHFHVKGGICSSPSIGVNGLIYVVGDSVYCLDQKGRRRWAFGTPDGEYFFGGAVPDLAGNVYAGNDDGSIYCIGPNGRLRWRAPVPDEDEIKTEVTIGPGDTLFLGSDGYYLFRKAPNDVVRIMYEANDALAATPALSAAGTSYFLPDDGVLYALSSTGRMVWQQDVAASDKSLYYTSSPTIGPDGTVYVGSWDGVLYAFEGDGPPARSLWPQYRHDAQHTGRLTKLPKK